MITSQTIHTELQRIAAENEGKLRAKDVVDAARPLDSPLHSHFEWDDTEAAEQWRMAQARQLIRVTVEVMQVNHHNKSVRVFVSLTPDRHLKDGGYRTMVSVLEDSELRSQLLNDALNELANFERKYRDLRELSEVFQAARRVRTRMRRRSPEEEGGKKEREE